MLPSLHASVDPSAAKFVACYPGARTRRSGLAELIATFNRVQATIPATPARITHRRIPVRSVGICIAFPRALTGCRSGIRPNDEENRQSHWLQGVGPLVQGDEAPLGVVPKDSPCDPAGGQNSSAIAHQMEERRSDFGCHTQSPPWRRATPTKRREPSKQRRTSFGRIDAGETWFERLERDRAGSASAGKD